MQRGLFVTERLGRLLGLLDTLNYKDANNFDVCRGSNQGQMLCLRITFQASFPFMVQVTHWVHKAWA